MKKVLFVTVIMLLSSVVMWAGQFTITQNPIQLGVTPVPPGRPIVVQLFKNVPFANAPKPAATEIVLPKGNWGKVILDITGTQQGRQFDRIMEVSEDGIDLFVGITPEPTKKGIAWHIRKDITSFLPILAGKHTFKMLIGNYVSKIYTGIPKMSVKILFYPKTNENSVRSKMEEPIGTKLADEIVKVFSNSRGFFEAVGTRKNNKTVSATVTCPDDVKAAVLHLYVLGQMNDEFWWANQPAFREVEIWVDGKPAGVIWPFPYIYTGGVNPLLWRPLTGVRTLNIPSYSVDLTPFAGLLGGTHKISVKIEGNSKYWLVEGYLSLYTTHGQKTWGKIVKDTLVFPTKYTSEESTALHNKGNQVLNEMATKVYEIEGVVSTKEGQWNVTDTNELKFANDQINLAQNWWQLVHGIRIATSTQRIENPDGSVVERKTTRMYTIDCAGAYIVNKKYKSFLLPTNLSQMLNVRDEININGANIFWSKLNEMIEGYASLEEDNRIATIKQGDTSGYYSYEDSEGHNYHRTVMTRGGVVVYEGN